MFYFTWPLLFIFLLPLWQPSIYFTIYSFSIWPTYVGMSPRMYPSVTWVYSSHPTPGWPSSHHGLRLPPLDPLLPHLHLWSTILLNSWPLCPAYLQTISTWSPLNKSATVSKLNSSSFVIFSNHYHQLSQSYQKARNHPEFLLISTADILKTLPSWSLSNILPLDLFVTPAFSGSHHSLSGILVSQPPVGTSILHLLLKGRRVSRKQIRSCLCSAENSSVSTID